MGCLSVAIFMNVRKTLAGNQFRAPTPGRLTVRFVPRSSPPDAPILPFSATKGGRASGGLHGADSTAKRGWTAFGAALPPDNPPGFLAASLAASASGRLPGEPGDTERTSGVLASWSGVLGRQRRGRRRRPSIVPRRHLCFRSWLAQPS